MSDNMDDGLLKGANMQFYDNIIIDSQNAKKRLEEIRQPLLTALGVINVQLEAIDKTIAKYFEKRKETENDYLRYSATSSTSSL